MNAGVGPSERLVEPLPPLFAEHFDHEVLAQETRTLVALDERGIILWCNPAWHWFAEANGGTRILEDFGVGKCYFDGISEPLRGFYRAAFQEAYSSHRVFEQEYECSSPTTLRVMRLRALPIEKAGLLVEHCNVWQGGANGGEDGAVAAIYLNEHGLILQCSGCHRIRRRDTPHWDWVSSWAAVAQASISHGMCGVCVSFHWGRHLRAAGRAKDG